MSSTSLTGAKYIPGRVYYATLGTTQAEFESPRAYDFSAAVEQGFINDKGAANKAIIVFNMTGLSQAITLDRSPPINKLYGNERFNERETQGVVLENGRSTHFPISTRCFIVSIGEYRIGEDGKEYWESSLGKRLNELANTTLTVDVGAKDGEIEVRKQSNMQQAMYFLIENLADRDIWIKIVQENQAYKLSEKEVQAMKRSRKVDLGAKVVEEKCIKPGATFYFKRPPQRWYVRALDVYSGDNNDDQLVQVPPMKDYVQNAVAQATAGDMVLLFQDETRNGGIVAVTYNSNRIKFVSPDIVVTLPNPTH